MYHGIQLQHGFGSADTGLAKEEFGRTNNSKSDFSKIEEIQNNYSEDFIIYRHLRN